MAWRLRYCDSRRRRHRRGVLDAGPGTRADGQLRTPSGVRHAAQGAGYLLVLRAVRDHLRGIRGPQQLSQHLFLRPIWVVAGGVRLGRGSLRAGRKFLPPSGRLHRRSVRGTPCALRALPDHRALYWSGVPVAPVPGGLFCSVSGHGLPGHGKRSDLSGRAPAIPARNRDHLRACRRSWRPRRLSLALCPGSLQRSQRNVCNGLRPVRRGGCVDHAGRRDVLASEPRDHGSPHLTPTARISIVDKAFCGKPMKFDTIENAIADIRNGRMVILVDDEDRENEGDFVMAAEKVTPEAINFMAMNGRGLICFALTPERVEELQLPPMVAENTAPFGTAFTISIDARRSITTGISAKDRATTILTAIDPKAKPTDLARPGHVFPLRADKGGVLKRAGQTEGSVDLPRLAALYPAGVLCEIMNDDGTIARVPQLQQMPSRHHLNRP